MSFLGLWNVLTIQNTTEIATEKEFIPSDSAMKHLGGRKVCLPEALRLRGKVVGWQQVSRRNTGTLTDAVALLGPEHHLDFLKRKHSSGENSSWNPRLCCKKTTQISLKKVLGYDFFYINISGPTHVLSEELSWKYIFSPKGKNSY